MPGAAASDRAAPPALPPASRFAAKDLKLGKFSLGRPAGLIAAAEPELWKRRRSESGPGFHAVILGTVTKTGDGDLGDALIALLGPTPPNEPAATKDERFVPNLIILLDERAVGFFSPRLPSFSAPPDPLGQLTFATSVPFVDAEEREMLTIGMERPNVDATQREKFRQTLREIDAQPKRMRLAGYEGDVVQIDLDDSVVGYVLGSAPRDEEDPFYKHLRQLVAHFYGYH